MFTTFYEISLRKKHVDQNIQGICVIFFLKKNCFLVQRGQLRHFLWASPTLLGEQFTTTLNPVKRTAFCSGWVWESSPPNTIFLILSMAGRFFLKLYNMDRLQANDGLQTESPRSVSWTQAGGKGSILGSSESRSVGLLKDLENECFLFHYLQAPSSKFSKEENSTFKDSRSWDQDLVDSLPLTTYLSLTWLLKEYHLANL